MRPYYEHGGIVIYHGDCLEVLPHVTADALVTDTPYGIAYASNMRSSWQGTEIHGDQDAGLRDEVLRRCSGMPAIVFGSWKRPRPAATRAVLVWDKGPACGMGDLTFPWKCSHEEIYVMGDGFHGHRGEGVLRYHIVTWESKGRTHPNEKPVELMMHLVRKCPPGAILDPFMGSGTTLRAAKDLGRRAIGIEIEERYCEIAARRLAQETLAL